MVAGKLLQRLLAVLSMAGVLVTACVSAGQAAAPVVLTGTQATYSIARALVAGTSVEVRNIPPDGRELALLKDYIERRIERLAPEFAAATAVITLTNALPEDPLYRFAREANIRIVNIDAAVPWSVGTPGVALTDRPVSTVEWGGDADQAPAGTAPYFWLGISNAMRMADIVAADLGALFPEAAGAIGDNLGRFKRALLELRSEYQTKLIDAGGDLVFALTGDLVYFTSDLGLLVDGYFIKQDVRWTPDDLANLTRHLREHQIGVVLHRWMPSEPIVQAVQAAGARLAVLQTGDPGIVAGESLAGDGLQQILRGNLDAVLAALEGR